MWANELLNKLRFQLRRMKKLGVSFSYGGAYVAYYYGVYEYLHETFDLATVAYFSGISAGCQVAYWMACGVDPSTAWEKWFIPTFQSGCVRVMDADEQRCVFPELRKTALQNIQALYDPSVLEKCNNSLFIGVTELDTLQKVTIHTFTNPSDLFGALLASQCIPFLFDTHVSIRGVSYIDGAISHHSAFEPCDGHWIHINVFKWENMHVLGSLASLVHLNSHSYHMDMKKLGYEAAKRRRKWLMHKGLKRLKHPLVTINREHWI